MKILKLKILGNFDKGGENFKKGVFTKKNAIFLNYPTLL